jgi:hypothetical protein
VREQHAQHLEALADQLGHQLLGATVARVVAVVGDEHALDAVRLERGEDAGREALGAVAAGHVGEAGTPEGHGVDQRLAQDHFALAGFALSGLDHAGQVEHARMRPRQVQVFGRARPQVVQELAAVHLHHGAGCIEHRHHQRAVEVLVPAVAQDADRLQALADGCAILAVLLRQPQAQRAVGHAEPEGVHQSRVIEPARLEVREPLARLLQPLLVVVDRLRQQRLVVGIQGHRRRQCAHRRALSRRRAGREGGIGLQQLHRVAEAHAPALHHPVDRASPGTAPEAVPQVLASADVQRWLGVRAMERTPPQPVLAALLQLHPRGLDQALHRHLVF